MKDFYYLKEIMKLNGLSFTNGPTCKGVSFVSDASHDIAEITITGRYPEKGFAKNQVSHELVYILEGAGNLTLNGKEQDLKVGDVISVPPNQPFAWDGRFKMIMSCQPKFDSKQYIVEEAL
jgi:hypothetical protein